MTFLEMKTMLAEECKQEELEYFFGDWLNHAVLEIAGEFELPDLKLSEPATVTTDGTNWKFDMPSTYHKKVFMARNDAGDELRIYRQILFIENMDPGHSDTGTKVTHVAVEGSNIATYPLASDTIYLWYYKKPTDMVNDADTPEGIPAAFHENVLLPRTMMHAAEFMQDMTLQRPPEYWINKYKEGIALMVDYFDKIRGVK